MTMLLYDALAPNPYVVRLFALERGGLSIKSQVIDIMALENRKPRYRDTINSRGELPALVINNNDGSKFILTEITAICEYLDSIAIGGVSLYGSTPLEKASTRMWLRRIDLEIAQPVIEWYRNDPATIDFYKGNRIPTPEARTNQKVLINQALNRLDEELEGKEWICGDRFSAADIHFYGLMNLMVRQVAEWVVSPTRGNVKGWFERMEKRSMSEVAMGPIELGVDG